jgi:hypothetical protein
MSKEHIERAQYYITMIDAQAESILNLSTNLPVDEFKRKTDWHASRIRKYAALIGDLTLTPI